MAKYWMFQNNQVKGPYDADDLSQVAGFSAESLVCSDGRKGTNMGDWSRASMVPELSVALLKASQLAVALKPGGGGGFYPGLPPEPTLKDLAQLGSLQEKVSLLDNTVSGLQDSLRLREGELLSLHRELDEKNRQAGELAQKLGSVEERLAAINVLQAGLDKTAAAEHDLETTIDKQSKTISELSTQIQSLQGQSAELRTKEEVEEGDIRALKEQIEKLKAENAELRSKEDAEESKLRDIESEMEKLKNRPVPAAPPPVVTPLSAPAPFKTEPPSAAPTPFGSTGTPFGGKPATPFGSPESLQPAAGEKLTPLSEPPKPALDTDIKPVGFGGGAAPMGFNPLSAPPPPGMTPMPTTGEMTAPPPPSSQPEVLTGAPQKKSGGKGGLIALVVIAAVAGAAVKLHLIPLGKKKPAPVEAPVAPPPVIPKGPTPEELAEQEKKAAIEFVRTWPVPGGLQTVGQVLEGASPQDGALPQWMAEKVTDGLYAVNFYPKSNKNTKTFEFQASLTEKKVIAHNEPAAALLTPAADKLKKPGKGGKKKSKSGSDSNILQDLLSVPSDDEGGAPNASAKKVAPAKPAKPRNVAKELDDVLGDEPAAKKPKIKAKPAKKEEGLDELLVPGDSANPGLAEPEGAPSDEDALPEPTPAPAAKKKAAPKPADAELLDDLLKP